MELGTTWHHHYCCPYGYYEEGYRRNEYVSDTLINGVSYIHIIGESHGSASSDGVDWSPSSYVEPDYILLEEGDAIYELIDGTLYLVMDYSANAGQDLTVYDSLFDNEISIRVDSTETSLLYGQLRRVKHVSLPIDGGAYWHPLGRYVEGIGRVDGDFWLDGQEMAPGFWDGVYSESCLIDLPSFPASAASIFDCTTHPLGLNEEKTIQYLLSENPSIGFYTISFPNGFEGDISLFSSEGRVLNPSFYQKSFHLLELDLRGNLSGMYFLNLQSKDGQSQSLKLIKL